MILLSVDTSGSQGSLALARGLGRDDAAFEQVVWTKKAMHSEVATVELQQLLARAALELRSLTHVAVNIGPGSFTGLRVGISLAKTLAYSLNLPLLGISRLEVLAFHHSNLNDKTFVAVKAIQKFFYCGGYLRRADDVTPDLSPRSLLDSEIAAASKSFTKVLIEGQTAGFKAETEAKDLIQLLAAVQFRRPFSDWKSVTPLYIRASEAEEKLKMGLLKPV